jgi:PTS system nitrogen regulatory IIA component
MADDILLELDVANKAELLEEVGKHMERQHGMPREWGVLSLARREQVGSTGLGEGVAIPHARIRSLFRMQLAYARLRLPIPFDAPDGKPVGDVLVLLVPKEATEAHLRILAEATQMFSSSAFRESLHACRQAWEVRQLFSTWPLAA